MKNNFQQLHDSVTEMRDAASEMRNAASEIREEIDKTLKLFGWSDWEPHTVGIIPRRVNGRWYFKGDTVYRKEKMWGLSGSQQYKYGDDFDVLRDE